MGNIDAAIDDLIEAAGLPEGQREFELRIRRRKLNEEIDKVVVEARQHALMWGAG
jgi:hypothetical protein